MIEPFALKTKFNGVSYGLSHCGYDIRVSEDIRMWSQDFLLAASLERFDMPLDWCGIVHDKSTWIRKGLCVHNTVIEPGWCGYLTLELGFHGQGIIDVPKGTGIAQIIFHKLDEPTEMPYEGKYQDQKAGPQEAKFE
jgi:dCTP deaminase